MTAPYTPNLEALLALLSGKARTPADATFTTAKEEGDFAKARREALETLQANQQIVHGPDGHGFVSVRTSAPLYTQAFNGWPEFWKENPTAQQGYQQGSQINQLMFGPTSRGNPDRGNAQAVGSRASDSLALNELEPRLRRGSRQPDVALELQIARLKAVRARNSNNPG